MASQANAVLVISGDTIMGLNVVRSLGRRGIPVYCTRTQVDSLGPRSTYCRGSFLLPSGEDEMIAAILKNANRWKVTHLVGISENHIALMNRHRCRLEREFTLLFPPQHIFERATHKHLTLEFAARACIPVPRTVYPQAIQEIRQCGDLRFPVILKMSQRELPCGSKLVFQHKYLRVDTFESLERVLGGLPPGQFPMVQEFIPGSGIGMSMLVRGGKAVLAFQHRRLRESPPEGGVGVYCEAMPIDPRLFEQSERLLVSMGWDGVAMVEYRGNPETGSYTLMEVNGRFWGSLPTAIHAGADFPFWLYRTSLPEAPTPDREYRVGLRARTLAGDTKWLASVLLGRKAPAVPSIAGYLASFRPSTRYFIWAWDDPRPAVRNFLGRLWRR